MLAAVASVATGCAAPPPIEIAEPSGVVLGAGDALGRAVYARIVIEHPEALYAGAAVAEP